MMPGRTNLPVASMTRASWRRDVLLTAAIFAPRMSTEPFSIVPFVTVRIVAFLMRVTRSCAVRGKEHAEPALLSCQLPTQLPTVDSFRPAPAEFEVTESRETVPPIASPSSVPRKSQSPASASARSRDELEVVAVERAA
jgi:hypothetical protein